MSSLLLFEEKIAVYYDNHNGVKANDAHSDHWALK
jgi:hypothetical protein